MSESQQLSINRRQFIKITAFAGLAAGLGSGLTRKLSADTLHRVGETRIVMGTLANLTIVTDDPATAKSAIQTTFAHMEQLESIFSRFRPDSQLSRLNQAGVLRGADSALLEVLERAVRYGDLTGGIFDITVEPLLALYRQAAKTDLVLEGVSIAAARQLVDYRRLSLQGSTIRLTQPGMAITLDGIAKGYIIDQGAAELSKLGFENVLVEVGGDMQACGQSEASPWSVGIQSPDEQETVAVVELQNMAMATSGDYQNVFTADRKLHHILNPRTGVSPGALSSVSVLASTACDADALSTSVLALGPDAGLALVERLDNVEAYLITKERAILRSSGFPTV